MAKREKKNKDWKLLASWIIVYITAFLMFFSTSINSPDPDFGWHLRVGKDIANSGRAPTIETYTFHTLGQEWVDHEWLSNLFLYWTFSSSTLGYWLLGIIFSLIALGCFFLILTIIKEHLIPTVTRWNFFLITAPLLLFNVHLLRNAFGIRLQVLSWFFITTCFWLFIRIYKHKSYGIAFVLPLLFALWANLHGSFIFGLAAMLAFFTICFFFQKSTFWQKMLMSCVTLLSFAATLFTPYHTKLWELIGNEYTQNRYYLDHISEWLPLYAAPNINFLLTFYIAFFLAIFIVAIKQKLFSKNLFVWLYIVFVFTVLYASIEAKRFYPFFLLASFPLISYAALSCLPKFQPNANAKKWITALLFVIFSLTSVRLFFSIKNAPLDPFVYNSVFAPFSATNFLKTHEQLDDLPLYNLYEWGGYLAWTWQEKEIFIDGRMPQKPLTNGVSLLEEYYSFREAGMAQQKLDEYNIKLVLLPQDKPFSFKSRFESLAYNHLFFLNEDDFKYENHLLLCLDSRWQIIYSDDLSIVYLHPSLDQDKFLIN